jgi:hypothetical protein
VIEEKAMNSFLIQVTEGHKAIAGFAPWFVLSLLLFAGAGFVVFGALSRQGRGEQLGEWHGDRNLWMVLPLGMSAFGILFFVLGFFYK